MRDVLNKFKLLSKYDYDLKSTQQKLIESFIDKKQIDRYSQRMSEMISIFETENNLIESEDNQIVLDLIKNLKFDKNSPEFNKALKSGNRGEFLSDYSLDDYGKMDTYKLKNYNIGFAIKSDGDIVSVLNNSGIKGIGDELIKSAISLGGSKLDHFDGFLTGFYSRNGFKVVKTEDWNDDYTPSDWKYEAVDIYNPDKSVYAKELKKYNNLSEIPPKLKHKINMYKEGKPDIIYRSI
jgi:hypothetical protein